MRDMTLMEIAAVLRMIAAILDPSGEATTTELKLPQPETPTTTEGGRHG